MDYYISYTWANIGLNGSTDVFYDICGYMCFDGPGTWRMIVNAMLWQMIQAFLHVNRKSKDDSKNLVL